MKAKYGLLLGCLFLLTTPMFALAHGGERDKAPQQYRGWVQDRHEHGDHYRGERSARWERRGKKHFKQRHHRARKYAQRQRRPYYVSAPAVVYSVPRIVFRIDW